jgi:hypothetical protein
MNKQTKLIFTLPLLLVATMFLVSAISITDVSSSPDQVAPGSVVDITIEVENIFEYDVENVQLRIDLTDNAIPFAPYQSSSEKFLDEIGDGDEEDFEFELIVLPEASSGIYKVPVEISYEHYENDTLIQTTKQELISLTVNAQPELKMSLENENALIKGQESEISVKVINSGLADVKFVYLSITDINGIEILSQTEQYIGDIDSDDFDNVDFNIYIESNSPDTLSLPVTIKFKDATNKEFTQTETISLKIYSLKQAQDLGLAKKPNYVLYFAITILILAYVLYRILKKRKKRK